MIEAEVHTTLRAFLRARADLTWPHHLTMARLVARALRLGRPALVQTGSARGYCLSYLASALLWDGPVLLVAPKTVRQRLLAVHIPRLQEWLQTDKPICSGDRLDDPQFRGLMLVKPADWLGDRLGDGSRFGDGVPTLIDRAEDLEDWTRRHLGATLDAAAWNLALATCPTWRDRLRQARVRLTKTLFERPRNPYNCHLLDAPETEVLYPLLQTLAATGQLSALPAFEQYWQQWRSPTEQLLWADVDRMAGHVSLHCAPAVVSDRLAPVWQRQPVVLVGGFLDWETAAPVYRQQLGLGDLTCLRFAPDRHTECVRLYLPDRLPLPNSPQFRDALLRQLRALFDRAPRNRAIVVLVGDVPLKAQVAATLAAERGTRVQLERGDLAPDSILVTGWEFWRKRQETLPTPHLLVVATLPLPSLEHPLVAGRVNYYRRRRLDWFRLYLLPTALRELQRAIAPVREANGVVALLDNRVIHRSYGRLVLAALEPCARANFLDGVGLGEEIYGP
ncbi:Rad3-related DNA helicase [Rubidibacter lacunae KORDI 51-2]|uniref:Rad3-related DNA helicase n=1 Tax=Rubidibacter lacunae KORDI 51-2 TaxID=582515 RepID=U5DP26_9CHRO|nr:helicase C-terminal domain-containing protein [Rubidibacter lacunae]ERN42364.1 Rad3-related DNA helicase [Rubidibacter lacunae KORDI 51-2]